MRKAARVAHTVSDEQLGADEYKIPLYHQMFLLLKSKIADGEYKPGDFLPSERDISEIFGVSRITAKRALNELAACGAVVRETGRGTRVRPILHAKITRGATTPERGDAPALGTNRMRPVNTRIVSFDYIAAAPSVSAALAIPPGAIVQYSMRTLHLDRGPYALVSAFVPEVLGRNWTEQELQKKPLFKILEDAGLVVVQVEESVTATLADMTSSVQLGVTVGSPLIKIERTVFGAEGRPIEHMIGLYRPDRYRYTARMPGSELPR